MKVTINGVSVNPVLGSARLEKSRDDAAASLTATIWTAAADTYFQQLSLAVGDVVRLTDDAGAERFLGSIHRLDRTPERVSLTAFDRGVYLSRNEVRGVFAGSGSDICRQIAQRLGVAVGTLDADSTYQVLTAPRGENAFLLLRRAAGTGREVTVEGEALTVRRQSAAAFILPTEQVLKVSASADIRNVVDRCQVVDRKGSVLAAAENGGDRKAYGLFQTIVGKSGDPAAQARAHLSGMAKRAEVTLLGNLGYRVGCRVLGRQPEWGLDGTYTITALCHRWEEGQFTTELTLEEDT